MNKLIEDYRNNKKPFLKYIRKEGFHKLVLYCASNSVPLVAAYTYLKEDMPEYAEVCDKEIDLLCEFYGYERG